MANSPTFDDYLRRLYHIESGGDPYNRTGSNRGLAQFGPQEERMYGINDSNRHLPEVQGNAVAQEYAKNHKVLTKALGREPTFAEHYLTHQQGIAGGPALLSGDPNATAWKTIRPFYKSDAVAKSAIMGNIPSDSPLKKMDVNDISNGGFTGMWGEKFNRGLPGGGGPGTAPPGVAVAANAPPSPPPSALSAGGSGNLAPFEGLFGGAPPSGSLPAPAGYPAQPAAPGPGATAVAAGVGAPAGPTPDGTTLDVASNPALMAAQKFANREKDAETEKQSSQMMKLAQQLMAAGQAPKPNFMQLSQANTGPTRPLPLNLPPGFGSV